MMLCSRVTGNSPRSSVRAATMTMAAAITTILSIQSAAASPAIPLDIHPKRLVASAGENVPTPDIADTLGNNRDEAGLFLNLGGFDPAALLSIDRIVGAASFRENVLSPSMSLFSVTPPGVPAGSSATDITLRDFLNNTINPVAEQADVSVLGIPEPSPGLLSAFGLLTFFVFVRVPSSAWRDRPGA